MNNHSSGLHYSQEEINAMLKEKDHAIHQLKEDNKLLTQIKKKDEEMLLVKDAEIQQIKKALAQSQKLVSFKISCIKSLLIHIEYLHTFDHE